jgi:hypothetical protein
MMLPQHPFLPRQTNILRPATLLHTLEAVPPFLFSTHTPLL